MQQGAGAVRGCGVVGYVVGHGAFDVVQWCTKLGVVAVRCGVFVVWSFFLNLYFSFLCKFLLSCLLPFPFKISSTHIYLFTFP